MLKGYLAGPIENCTPESAIGWRLIVQEHYAGKIKFHNPMCGKEDLVKGYKFITQENYAPETINLTKKDSIFGRDLLMINDSEFLLVNLPYTKKFSKGTMFEIGYAYALGKIIIVVSKIPEIVNHPFIARSSVVFGSFEDAFEFLDSLVKDFNGA